MAPPDSLQAEDDGPANYAFPKRRGFDIVHHDVGRSKALTLEAKMMLTIALGLPAGFRLSAERFVAQFCHVSEGRKKILRIMGELEHAHHLRRVRSQGARGRWQTRNEWYEDPRDNPEHPENPVNVALASTDLPPVDNQGVPPKSPYGTSVTSDAKAQVGPKAPHGTSGDGTSVHGTIEKELGRRTNYPLTPVAPTSEPIVSVADGGGEDPPTPQPLDDHGLEDPRRGRPARPSRPTGANPRALGQNPRAKAQRAAEAAKRAEVLTAARAFGARTAAVEPDTTPDELRERLVADARRDPSNGWDPERIKAAVDGVGDARAEGAHLPTAAPPTPAEPSPVGPRSAREALRRGRGAPAGDLRVADPLRLDLGDAGPEPERPEARLQSEPVPIGADGATQ